MDIAKNINVLYIVANLQCVRDKTEIIFIPLISRLNLMIAEVLYFIYDRIKFVFVQFFWGGLLSTRKFNRGYSIA